MLFLVWISNVLLWSLPIGKKITKGILLISQLFLLNVNYIKWKSTQIFLDSDFPVISQMSQTVVRLAKIWKVLIILLWTQFTSFSKTKLHLHILHLTAGKGVFETRLKMVIIFAILFCATCGAEITHGTLKWNWSSIKVSVSDFSKLPIFCLLQPHGPSPKQCPPKAVSARCLSKIHENSKWLTGLEYF